jgi:Rv2175c C-terminal domain of unknown function
VDVLSEGPDGPREWLPLPDVADRLGIPVGKVRRLLEENQLLAMRRGERKINCVPAELLSDEGELIPQLPGTIVLLADSGFTGEESLRWLFTPDDSLPGTPLDALKAGRKTEVRRRAQALAF